MPKTHEYGASYPSGAIIAHDGTVTDTPDEGNEAPRIEDESRPGGAVNATPIDEDNPRDQRTLAGQEAKDKDGAEREREQDNQADEKPDATVKPLKRARNTR